MKIAISGKMQAGKTTCADYLVQEYGFDKYSFAASLKSALLLAGVTPENLRRKPPLVRQLMQVYGQVMRDQNPSHWIDRTLAELDIDDPEFVVVDDLRFLNEAEALRDLGWILIRVEREGWPEYLSPGSTDISEVDLDDFVDWDYVITAKEGELTKLFDAMDRIIQEEERK